MLEFCLLSGTKSGFFTPQGRYIAPINVKFGAGEVFCLMPNFTFIGVEMWDCSLRNNKNLEFCP